MRSSELIGFKCFKICVDEKRVFWIMVEQKERFLEQMHLGQEVD